MHRLPNLNALRVLATVADAGSFTAAAERLGVTQSAVSKQIAALEDELGQALFQRHHRRVTLTGYGAEVARVPATALDRLSIGLNAIPADRPRQLRIVADADFLLLWLNPLLPDFERAHPDIRLSLAAEVGLRAAPQTDYDLAIVWGEGLWTGCQFEALLTNRVFPVASPDYAARTGRAALPALTELHARELVHDQSRVWWSAIMRSVGAAPPDLDAGRLYNTSAPCLEAVARGEGVSIGDEVSTRGHLMAGRLICPWPVQLPSHHAYYLMRPTAVPDSADVASFRAWLLAQTEAHRRWFADFWASSGPQ